MLLVLRKRWKYHKYSFTFPHLSTLGIKCDIYLRNQLNFSLAHDLFPHKWISHVIFYIQFSWWHELVETVSLVDKAQCNLFDIWKFYCHCCFLFIISIFSCAWTCLCRSNQMTPIFHYIWKVLASRIMVARMKHCFGKEWGASPMMKCQIEWRNAGKPHRQTLWRIVLSSTFTGKNFAPNST